ncbi:hypothetical protein [Stieleria varia]|uniref:hypothetical protein n=1 Tax=Stieleria varia TaxID=2528005 RepID=UPI0018D23919|nr:hypothetical protein [Stieleria varia]
MNVLLAATLSHNVAAQDASQNAFQQRSRVSQGQPTATLGQPAPTATQASTPINTTPQGWNLRWRKSSRVTPAPIHVPTDDVFADNKFADNKFDNKFDNNVRPASSSTQQPTRPTTQQVAQQRVAQPSIRQSGWQQDGNGSAAPIRRVDHTTGTASKGTQSPADAFFSNPFMDDASKQLTQNPTDDVFNALPQPPANAPSAKAPTGDAPANPYRGGDTGMQLPGFGGETLELPPPPAAVDTGETMLPPAAAEPNNAAQPNNAANAADETTMRDLFQSEPPPVDDAPTPDSIQTLPPAEPEPAEPEPAESEPADATDPRAIDAGKANGQDSPSDLPPFQNPFSDRDQADRDRLRQQAENGQGGAAGDVRRPGGIRPEELSCDEFRDRIASETIDKLTLDISPPFRPDIFDPKKYAEERELFDKSQTARQWFAIDGTPLGTGRLIDLAYEEAIIETEYGARETLPLYKLSEGDVAYLTENWGLPRECLVQQVAYTPRTWTPMTMTWKASNICHKPKYFEEVNLERYGHTAGPILQPVVSSAHFFANIAVLPYKMGVHAPNECQYALGYYRPGNCAPWIIPPVPISARGAIAQGAFMTGAFWLIP